MKALYVVCLLASGAACADPARGFWRSVALAGACGVLWATVTSIMIAAARVRSRWPS